MQTVNDILQFNFSNNNLIKSAQQVFSKSLVERINSRIDILNKLSVNVEIKVIITPTISNQIPLVFLKFKKKIINNKITFEKRELRTLTYSLSYSDEKFKPIFESTNELTYLFTILDNDWRDSYLIGLTDCYLNNWGSENKQSLAKLSNFIIDKLNNYNGTRSTIKSLKSNIKYFDLQNGDIILGTELAIKKVPINEAPKSLNLPQSWIRYLYFSRVIVAYYEKRQKDLKEIIIDLEEVLKVHSKVKTSKRLICKLIIQANSVEYLLLQDKVKSLAFEFIGDPENKAAWAEFENATDKEKYELYESRKILNEWITKQFINVFFEKCINDPRRKRFWLQYSSKISSFKVYGSNYTKFSLKSDLRISDFIDNRYYIVNSNSDKTAFILYIGNYMLIEFSDAGFACNVYKQNSPNLPNLNHTLNNVEELRNSKLPLAFQSDTNYYYLNDEGRLFHNKDWEYKFSYWLEEKVLNEI